MAKKNVVRRDVVQIGFEIEKSPVAELENCIKEAQGDAKKMADSAESAAKKVASIGNEAEKSAKKTSKARKAAKKVTEEVSEIGKEAKKASDEASSIGDEAEKAAKKTKPLEDGLEDVGKEADKAKEKTEGIGDEAEKAAPKTKPLEDGIGGVGDEADKAKKKTEGLGEGIGGLGKGLGDLIGKGKSLAVVFAGAAAAFSVGKLIDNVSEVDQAMNKLAAQTGASGAEMESYRKSVQSLYNGGTGESIGEVADAMALVRQQFKELDDGTIKSITNDAMVLTDTFDMDLNETLRGVNSLMVNMGLTADEAFDYIAKGAQNGLDKSGELSDNIAEYSQLWAQAGFSAEEMFTILQNGLDSGAYNLDKVNDFVKEFSISLSDGRIAENIDSFSEKTKQLFNAWKNGEASQKDVFNSIINDLSSMTNEQEALTVASNVWSALGEDNAMKVITSLNNVNDTYNDVKGTMESINNVRYDDLQTSMDKVSRSASNFLNETFAPAVSVVNDVVSTGIDKVTEFAQEHETLSTAFSAAALTATALTIGVGGVVAAGNLLPPLITKISASFTAMNLSMGPVGIALLGISAGVGLVTAAVKLSDDEVADYNGTMEECANEIGRTQAAYNKACKMYGRNSTAAQELSENLETLNAQYVKGGGVAEEYAQKLEQTSDKIDDLRQSQYSAFEELDKNGTSAYTAIAMLDSLSEKVQLTSVDLDLMSEYADYLNDTFHCNIEVDYSTGELTGFDPQALASEAAKKANNAKIQVATENITNGDFATEYQKAYSDYIRLQSLYEATQKEYNDAINYDTASNYHPNYMKRINEYQSALESAKQTVDEYNAVIEENGSIIDETGEFTKGYIEQLQSLASGNDIAAQAVNEHTDSLQSEQEGIDAATYACELYTDEILALSQAYDEAYQSALESFQGQFGLFDQASMVSEGYLSSTVSNAQAALDSQLAYWDEYSSNIQVLKNTSAEDLGITQENYDALMSFVQSGNEEAAGLADSMVTELENGHTESVAELANTLGDVTAKQEEIATATADWSTNFSTEMDSIVEEMNSTVKGMDLSPEANAAATSTINSYASAIRAGASNASSAAQSVVDAVQAVFNNANLSYSVDSVSGAVKIDGHAAGTTNSEDVFVAGEQGAELIVGKKGSTVFPASETNKIINAVQDYAGGYQPETSTISKSISNTTYAPQFTLNLNGASATESNKRTVKRWVKESLNEVFNNLAADISPVVEV